MPVPTLEVLNVPAIDAATNETSSPAIISLITITPLFTRASVVLSYNLFCATAFIVNCLGVILAVKPTGCVST
ncbi:hypothetical protein D3C87_1028200 [compost metagenome]